MPKPTGGKLPAYSELSRDEAKLMRVFVDHSEPIGARLASRELREAGLALSEATVSRLFAKLDASGYTRPIGRKGRVATDAGRAMAEAALRNELASAKLTRALDIQQVEQLIDLLHVRRGVEREAAVLAASRATPEDLADLRANVEQYDNAVAEHGVDSNLGNDFHRLIIKAAHSPLLETLSNLTLNERIDALEPVLFVITKGHGTIGSDPKEHLAILDALERGDVQEADRVQTEHLTRLITEVEEFARTNDAELFQRILQLAR